MAISIGVATVLMILSLPFFGIGTARTAPQPNLAEIGNNPAYASNNTDGRFVAFTETKDARVGLEASGPIKFDMPNQPIPYIANGTDYTINVTFFRPDIMAAMKNVKYNILILNGDGEEIFSFAKQNGTDSLYSVDGKATVRYNFAEIGGAGIRAVFLGQNSQDVEPQNADFEFQVVDSREIPEFGSAMDLLMAVGVVGFIIVARYSQQDRHKS